MPLQRNSGGGGTPINGFQIFEGEDVKINKEGQEFLRTGYLETDIASYPDALKSLSITNPSSTVLTVPSEPVGGVRRIAVNPDNGFIYVVQADGLGVINYYNDSGVHQGALPSVITGQIARVDAITFANGFLYVTNDSKISKFQTDGTFVEDYPNTLGYTTNPVNTNRSGIIVIGDYVYQFRHITTTMTICATDLSTTENGGSIFTWTTGSPGYPVVGIMGFGTSLYCGLQSGTAVAIMHGFDLRGGGAPVKQPNITYVSFSFSPAVAIKDMGYGNGQFFATDGTSIYKHNPSILQTEGVGILRDMYEFRYSYVDDPDEMYGAYYMRIK